MPRLKPTRGNVEFFGKFFETYIAKFSSNHTPNNKEEVFGFLREMQGSYYTSINGLDRLGVIGESSRPKRLDQDNTPHMTAENGWDRVILEDLVDGLGRYGTDAISCLAEGLLFTNALAVAFEVSRVFYRGEHNYGWKLLSSAERKLDLGVSSPPGFTKQELDEIYRFQSEVLADESLIKEIFGGKAPDPEHYSWLPAMQHYDTQFGTRLLDLTRSVFAGLYFSCINWNGTVDEDHDGILYVFFDSSSRWRGQYFEARSDVDELDNITPTKLRDSFKDWTHPEYFRLYETSSMTPRELAQDGAFLVRGIVGGEHMHGQGFKFRVPAECKIRILKELWFAGFTPSRIVRGQTGREAESILMKRLGVY